MSVNWPLEIQIIVNQKAWPLPLAIDRALRDLLAQDADESPDRDALAQVLREIGPKPGGVMEPEQVAQRLLDHEWFKSTIERRGAELHAHETTPLSPALGGDDE